MIERDIYVQDVRSVLEHGEAIEVYPADARFPSRLVLGWSGTRPLHVVAADDPDSDITVVITVYQPDPQLWEHDFRKRRP
ncbi:MAG: DUF4258 domain-containing protein [Gemmatimonadetes bacterium]|nr:DUF4258 domain-containing protein [Gemmatimonadota bacterium]